jgi:hypothetical protein
MHLGIREGVKVRVLHRISEVHHTFHRGIFPSNPPGVSFESIKIFQLIIFETHLNLVSLFSYFSVRLKDPVTTNISKRKIPVSSRAYNYLPLHIVVVNK